MVIIFLKAHKSRSCPTEIVGYFILQTMKEYFNYKVNDDGSVLGFKNNKLKPQLDKYGYHTVNLYIDRKMKTVKIHRLVAMCYIDNPENKPCVNHINGIKTDNRVENLEWCTVSENTKHSWNNKLSTSRKGETCNFSKLKELQVEEIRKLHNTGNFTQQKLADIFEISRSQIGNIVNNKRWVI